MTGPNTHTNELYVYFRDKSAPPMGNLFCQHQEGGVGASFGLKSEPYLERNFIVLVTHSVRSHSNLMDWVTTC